FITITEDDTMSNTNPNDTKLEQQRSDSAEAALESQTEDNHNESSEAAADRIAANLESSKEDK
ncbi:MAG: hypothetical protein ACTJHI_11195, partial [Psychrobacter sp.]